VIGECKDRYNLLNGDCCGKATKETTKLFSGDKIMGVRGKIYHKDAPHIVAF